MSAYFFVWNPEQDDVSFRGFDRVVARCLAGKPYIRNWICRSKRPCQGDQFYLQRTGRYDNGVFARGTIRAERFETDDGERVVTLEISSILPLGLEIPRDEITGKARFAVHWAPYASGDVIPDEILRSIDSLWATRQQYANSAYKQALLSVRLSPPARSTELITRALSIQQPYAELIMLGKKEYEYRSIPTNIRERVYVYATKKAGPKERWSKSGFEFGSLPTGVLVGTVEVIDCRENSDGYAWKLAHPKRAERLVKPKNQPQPVWFRPFKS